MGGGDDEGAVVVHPQIANSRITKMGKKDAPVQRPSIEFRALRQWAISERNLPESGFKIFLNCFYFFFRFLVLVLAMGFFAFNAIFTTSIIFSTK